MDIRLIDKLNSDKFKNGDNDDYICVMCECKVSLDDSISHQGYNLVCNRCYYRILDVLNTPYLMDDIHKAGAYRQCKMIEVKPTQEQREKLKRIFQLNSVYGVLSADTYDKLKQVEEEYIDARLQNKRDT